MNMLTSIAFAPATFKRWNKQVKTTNLMEESEQIAMKKKLSEVAVGNEIVKKTEGRGEATPTECP